MPEDNADFTSLQQQLEARIGDAVIGALNDGASHDQVTGVLKYILEQVSSYQEFLTALKG